jgi:hypothetical protein
MSTFKKIMHEIENLSMIITIPQLISAPISVIILHFLSPGPSPQTVIEVLDFLVISFPLTLAVALITLLLRREESGIVLYIGAVIGAALLSNLLHRIVSSAFPAIDVAGEYNRAFGGGSTYMYHGAGSLISFATKILSLYWKQFGVLMFLQSCVIGIYAGVKYFKKEDLRIIQ